MIAVAAAVLLATITSPDRLQSFSNSRKLLLLPLLSLAAMAWARPHGARTAYRWFVAALAISAVVAACYFLSTEHPPDARLRANGHYMTFAGLLLLATPLAGAAACGTRGRGASLVCDRGRGPRWCAAAHVHPGRVDRRQRRRARDAGPGASAMDAARSGRGGRDRAGAATGLSRACPLELRTVSPAQCRPSSAVACRYRHVARSPLERVRMDRSQAAGLALPRHDRGGCAWTLARQLDPLAGELRGHRLGGFHLLVVGPRTDRMARRGRGAGCGDARAGTWCVGRFHRLPRHGAFRMELG